MTTRMLWRLGVMVLAMICVVGPARAQDEDDDFVPRTGTPPAKRTGGASRGGDQAATISILAPVDSVGLTARAQPVIYWYLSADTKHPVEIAINDPRALEHPTIETTLEPPLKAGIHKLDLSAMQQDGKPVQLDAGVKYDVAIELMASEADASKHARATCLILRLDDKDAPADAGKEPDAAKRASMLGKSGIWFDYLDAMNAAIAANPKNETLLRKRANSLAAQKLIWKADGTITEQGGKAASEKQ